MSEWLKTNALTILTAAVAVYGAVLSTLNYRHARMEKARRLKVGLTGGYLTFGHGVGTHFSSYQCIIEVSNPGSTTVIVRSIYVLAGTLSIIIPAENSEAQRLPYELQPGQGFNCWIEARKVAVGLAQSGLSGTVKLRAKVGDATGSEYRSKAIEFDIDDMCRDD